MSADPAGTPGAELPDQALRSALEFAVGIAAAGAKLRPPLAVPPELKRFLRFHKLPPTALSQVRAAVEGDADFRKRLASVATEELVDPLGVLWLARPDGWAQAAADLLPAEAGDDEAAMRREERRRQAAQEAAARARAELLGLTGELERERAARQALVAETERMQAELVEVRQRLREAQRAEHASAQALQNAEAALSELRAGQAVMATQPSEPAVALDTTAVRTMIENALGASADLARLLSSTLAELGSQDGEIRTPETVPAPSRRTARRKALRLPGGVLTGSAEATEFLLRAAAVKVLVDGYNVAKLGWPALGLDHQREQCVLAAENLAKRWGVDITIVFDGASVEGAHATARRRVRVAYSPTGVSADDVLRAEVNATDAKRPVVVVTNDRAVLTDVKAAGANIVSSDAFLALAK